MDCRNLLLFLYFVLFRSSEQKALDDYIRHYEELRYDTSELHSSHLRAKRSTSDKHVYLHFKSHGRDFNLDLYPSTSVFSSDYKERHVTGKDEDRDISFIYEGVVTGKPGSHIHGAILQGIFRGTITIPGESIYFIEPARRFFGKQAEKLPFHSVIYSEENMNLDPYRKKRESEGHLGSCAVDKYRDWMVKQTNTNGGLEIEMLKNQHRHNRASRSMFYSEEANSPNNRNKRATASCSMKRQNTCNLYLRADVVLFNKTRDNLGGNEAAAKDEILSLFSSHVSAINTIYGDTVFKEYDKEEPCFTGVQFQIQRTTIMTDQSMRCSDADRNTLLSFCNPNIDVSNFLNLNSMTNHDEFCLAFVFTYRDFSGGTLGLAWVGSPSAAAGGVCERWKQVREDNRNVFKSLNTGIVTLVNYARRVAPRVSQLTFAHEVGHNFGSPHDKGSLCAPYGTTRPDADDGNYIMYASATKGDRPHNSKFSVCSKDNMTLVLDAVINEKFGKKNCFAESDQAFCGNGIVEDGEECDCGYDTDCKDQCCNPKIAGRTTNIECKLRQGKCSPTQGPCCTADCDFVPAGSMTCRHATDCIKSSKCSGTNATCPPSLKEEDDKFCNDFTQVCQDGECTGSLCNRIGHGDTTKKDWSDCSISIDGSLNVAEKQRLCYLACKESNASKCWVSDETDLPPDFRILVDEVKNKTNDHSSAISVSAGSPCNNYRGYCDVFKRCRGVDNDGPLERLKDLIFSQETLTTIRDWIVEYWWGVMLIAVGAVVLMGLFIKVCSYNTPSQDPQLKKNQRKRPEQRHLQPNQQQKPYYISGQNRVPDCRKV